MDRSIRLARALWAEEEAATMVEYAFMIALIAIACVTAASTLGKSLLTPLQKATTALS